MASTPIQTRNQSVIVEGKVFYTDKRRRIDLKKPIRDLFNVGIDPVNYRMELCLCEESTMSRVKELMQSEVRPVLLYFVEDERE